MSFQPRSFTDEEAMEFKLALRDPEVRRKLYQRILATPQAPPEPTKKRKVETSVATSAAVTAPLLDEEEMEILKKSRVFEEDEGKETEEDDDFLKEFDDDFEAPTTEYGGKRRRKSRKSGRKHKKSTKRHRRRSTRRQRHRKQHRTQRRH